MLPSGLPVQHIHEKWQQGGLPPRQTLLFLAGRGTACTQNNLTRHMPRARACVRAAALSLALCKLLLVLRTGRLLRGEVKAPAVTAACAYGSAAVVREYERHARCGFCMQNVLTLSVRTCRRRPRDRGRALVMLGGSRRRAPRAAVQPQRLPSPQRRGRSVDVLRPPGDGLAQHARSRRARIHDDGERRASHHRLCKRVDPDFTKRVSVVKCM